ncbi:protein SMAX1-LIKE 3-like [Ananas comosus]|uniref:Protein SMAX1-LIKE 3-like n=1 Tax=Ananas comosus TaxID=4615 RepID=A0A6P5H0A6_ANACO|nr:protein SMAX1-LIKE 3-like [Ananas comosus]
MRAGGCTVQQALAPEAAAIVKQAVSLARRRGHAQVTPLHVASAMLSSSAGLLRAACLRSHSHPLQCKALELCFNVALNRLPAAAAAPPIFSHHHHHTHYHQAMSLSNALVAAFKRAQAHQRRGSLESQQQQQQQQTILAVKIELEQLVISILDDPSISRVMREAGFSSTQVKCMVEKALSLDPNPNPNPSKPKEVVITTTTPFSPTQVSKARVLDHQVVIRNEDVVSILECMATRRKRRIVVVGECLATMEGAVRVVMDRVSKGEVPESLGTNLQFIPIQLHSFKHLPREEVDLKLGELRCLVKSFCGGNKGAVLLLEDLKWASEFWASCLEKGRGHYCPVEHVIMGIRSLVCGLIEGFWLMGFGTYETYMRCSGGNPSLEALWGLQVLTIPNSNLGLSLNCSSDSLSYAKAKISGNESSLSLLDGGVESQLTCCTDCSFKFNSEARSLKNMSYRSHSSIASNLPSWLQQYKEENLNSNDQGCLQVKDLCKKWNSICGSSCRNRHHPSEITLNFSSLSPSSSISSHDHKPWPLPLEAKHPWSEGYPRLSENNDEGLGPDSRSNSQEIIMGQQCNTNPNPNSASSSGTVHGECLPKFKELNAENLKILCDALEKRISWQKGIIPVIVSAVLRCRSGMKRRKGESKSMSGTKEETWLFFQGVDTSGKEIVARELAKLVFGSYDSFILVELNTSSSTRSDSSDDRANKRSRLEAKESYLDRLFEAIRENPHRVILMEDIEQVDYYSLLGIKKAIESGVIRSYNGDEVRVGDAIIILSCESFDSRSRACSPSVKQKVEMSEGEKEESEEISSSMCLDLNIRIEEDVECLFDNVGLIEAADQVVFFRLPEEL